MTEITNEVLLLLQCPITRQRLVQARPELLDRVNRLVDRGRLMNRLGENVEDRLDSGLMNEAGEWFYPVHDGIVCLLADEAISLDRFDIAEDERD